MKGVVIVLKVAIALLVVATCIFQLYDNMLMLCEGILPMDIITYDKLGIVEMDAVVNGKLFHNTLVTILIEVVAVLYVGICIFNILRNVSKSKDKNHTRCNRYIDDQL